MENNSPKFLKSLPEAAAPLLLQRKQLKYQPIASKIRCILEKISQETPALFFFFLRKQNYLYKDS
jgi:hypothetical protein